MDWSNPQSVLSEWKSLQNRFGELEKAGEQEKLPLSLLPEWATWAEENCRFEAEVRRELSVEDGASFWRKNYEIDKYVFRAWQKSRARLRIPEEEAGAIGELVRDELARLCVEEVQCEFVKFEVGEAVVAGDRLRTRIYGGVPPSECVVLKPGRCGWCYPEDAVESGSLIRTRTGKRTEAPFSHFLCGTCVGDWRVERALWGDERLRDAEVRRQYPPPPRGYRRRRHFRRGPDVVVGDRSWFVDVGELDTVTGNDEEDWRPELPVVVRMELEVMARKVSGEQGKKDECIVREVWRSDGAECREFGVRAFELAMFSPWRVPWKDEKERRSLQHMEELEREFAYMTLFSK